ncbi:hypothetical protein [Paenibacillus sp. UNC499MF]|uniref:hypothetical protein n=1 Tax=Paenibacillus sp. UNC499MF TaxID=1502751 RepID=UPI0008A03CE5|nr:hypothetical protein [Paenibacillus sp. UNC499MF]SEG57254.1 hypothetical protein SAMN02799616_03591 [Paenibacillus sp. UNC499MF]
MKNKKIFVTIAAAITLSSCIYLATEAQNQNHTSTQSAIKNDSKINISSTDAKVVKYDDLKMLESHSDLIIQAKVNGETKMKEFSQNNVVIDKVGVTPVSITKVFKGNLKAGEEISVFENGYYKQDNLITTAGYLPMNKNDDYLLFLTATPENGIYTVKGVYQGKFNLNLSTPATKLNTLSVTKSELDNIDFVGEDTQHFNDLKTEILNKYK